MKRTLLLVLVSLLSVQSFAQLRRVPRTVAQPAPSIRTNAQTLPIRRVILYSNGVAYIERRGTVTGHAEVSLSFKQSQVDDVLKSMVVLDLGQGRIGAGELQLQRATVRAAGRNSLLDSAGHGQRKKRRTGRRSGSAPGCASYRSDHDPHCHRIHSHRRRTKVTDRCEQAGTGYPRAGDRV